MKMKLLVVMIAMFIVGASVSKAAEPIPQAMAWKYEAKCSKTADGTYIDKWEHPTEPKPTKVQMDIDVAEYEQFLIDEQATQDALDTQVESEKTALPTWTQVVTAIDNAFPDAAQANIIKKIARPVYTYLKNSVD